MLDRQTYMSLKLICQYNIFLAGDMKPMISGFIPLGRLGTKLEIAHAVLFLAAETASYITGAVLVSDGGSWLASPGRFRPEQFSKQNSRL